MHYNTGYVIIILYIIISNRYMLIPFIERPSVELDQKLGDYSLNPGSGVLLRI